MQYKPPYKVLVTATYPDGALERLKMLCEVTAPPEGEAFSQAEIERLLPSMEGILCLLSNRIDAALIASAPKLRVISNYAVGYNNIDVHAASKRGIPVCNTPDVLTESTADIVFALILGVARRIVEGDLLVRNGQFTGWQPTLLLGSDVYGRTLGIIGLGRIGQAVAKRARGFAMNVLYHNSRRLPSLLEENLNVTYVELDELLRRSDFLSLNCPLVPQTQHLIGAKELAQMKSSAFLINAARGPVVDEEALVKALKDKAIAGAGLDVYENEPIVHPELLKMENVVLLPHLGSATTHTRMMMAEIAVSNLLSGLKGEPPQFQVNE